MATPASDAPRRRSSFALRSLLAVFGGYHLLLGGAMVVAPQTFFDEIASYGPYNDHYIRDVATFYVALGVVQIVAVARSSWQVPVLAFTVLQYGLHVVNHAWDVGDSDPAWIGPANLVSLALVGLLAWWLLRRAEADS